MPSRKRKKRQLRKVLRRRHNSLLFERYFQVKLIVGLGNPGEEYQFTRHNVGFIILDHLAEKHKIFLKKQGFDAIYGRGKIEDEAVLLAKPQTYMNLSGVAAARIVSYFKIDLQDLIVIHDDLDLPFQTIRLKSGGGDGGHKGLISIATHLGSVDFLRVRIGIGKPAFKTMTERYVLSPFSAEEAKVLPRLVATAGEAAGEIVLRGMQSAMRIYNGKELRVMSDE